MQGPNLRKALASRFGDELSFIRAWVSRPRSVGAILPTGGIMARRMASVIDTGSGLPVLEIGPGTGVITRAILARGLKPGDLHAVEYSPLFVKHLRRQFPDVNVIQGDAFDIEAALGPEAPKTFDSVVSSLPLLNFPVPARVAYLEGLLRHLPHGRPVIQFSYGPRSPIPPGLGAYSVEPYDFVVRNVPPARLWIYRHGDAPQRRRPARWRRKLCD